MVELFVDKWVSSLHKTIEKDLELAAIKNSIFTNYVLKTIPTVQIL